MLSIYTNIIIWFWIVLFIVFFLVKAFLITKEIESEYINNPMIFYKEKIKNDVLLEHFRYWWRMVPVLILLIIFFPPNQSFEFETDLFGTILVCIFYTLLYIAFIQYFYTLYKGSYYGILSKFYSLWTIWLLFLFLAVPIARYIATTLEEWKSPEGLLKIILIASPFLYILMFILSIYQWWKGWNRILVVLAIIWLSFFYMLPFIFIWIGASMR